MLKSSSALGWEKRAAAVYKIMAFNAQDWVKIKYGPYENGYGRVAALNLDGTYRVLPYSQDNEPQAMENMSEQNLELIEPFMLTLQDIKDLVRAKKNYEDLAQDIFPAFNVAYSKDYKLTASDIAKALKNINKSQNPLALFKEWFWLIENVLYENLRIDERYSEDIFSDAPENEDELFSTVFYLVEKMYWRLEERFSVRADTQRLIVNFEGESFDEYSIFGDSVETAAYKAVSEDVISRVRVYEYNKGLPRSKWSYCPSQMRHVISLYEDENDLKEAPEDVRELYRYFVDELYKIGDSQAMKILAWGHYEGDIIYNQDFSLAEKYLSELWNKTGDPFAANSLGYIYYYGRCNDGEPEYEKAFKYFSFGALAGVDESIYKAGDMLVHGLGTAKNVELGLNMIVDGYRDSLLRFCDGEYDNKFADYAIRMGNACRENLVYGMGIRDAYKFYLEAQFAIKKRMEIADYFGDKSVAKKIESGLKQIRRIYKPDMDKCILKADFPIYMSHIFEDHFPVAVCITKKKGKFYLEVGRTSAVKGEESKILVTYPELSFVALTSKLVFSLEGVGVIKYPQDSGIFLVDGFSKNEATSALEFYAAGELAAVIEAKWFVVDVKKEKALQKNNKNK